MKRLLPQYKWLIEVESEGVILYYSGLRQHSHAPIMCVHWTRDPLEANWYYGKQMAEQIIKDQDLQNARATEHEFVDSSRTLI